MSIPLHDPAWLERMYNNRALVPDYMDYLQRWAQDSAQVRANCPCALDLVYGPEAGETLDVFPATRPGAALAPVLVFIHGGYWRSLDKSDHSFVAPPFTWRGTAWWSSTMRCAQAPLNTRSPCLTLAAKWRPHWPGCGATSGSMVETAAASP